MANQYSNIPEELRVLKQWVLWRDGKVPYQISGQLADVTNSNTWNTFEACFNTFQMGQPTLGIGFVFSDNDPYAFIDLDNANGDAAILATHLKIAHEFDSYSEVSPSGMGLHIIVKGKVPAGRRRSKVEIYSSQRYATMTGNVHNNKSIIEYNGHLTQLWEQMGNGPVAQSIYKGDDKELYCDDEIIARATNAVNGDKFLKLFDGKWAEVFPHIASLKQGPSEADFALVDIIAFYTQNKAQIERLFYRSALGKRDKVKRKDYVVGMINKSFDRMLPPIDLDGFKNALDLKLAQPVKSNEVTTLINYELPPGLLGDIASFIYQAAPRPVPEVALAAAIGLMAGICGRAYNISGTGLNQYVLLLAMTGAGKEAAAEGIDKLMATIKMQVPTSIGFIGPSEISSGSALFKYLGNTSQCFVSLLGEFGLRIQQLSNPHANGAEVSLRRMILDLYNKSGANRTLAASAYSKKEDSTNAVASPSFSILGESTPERFYGVLNEDMISEGLLPRFLLIEYKGGRPPNNEQHTSVTPSFTLIERLASLAAQCETINHSNPRKIINVQSTPEAAKMLSDFDKYSDNKINGSNKDVIRQLWNRAHIKVLKLSALIAVGENMIDPVISVSAMNWAAQVVQADIAALTQRFEDGEIGANSFELKQANEIIRIVKEYVEKDFSYVSKYQAAANLHKDKIVSHTYLSLRLVKMAAFRNDRAGGLAALKRAINALVDNGKLIVAGGPKFVEKYGTNQKAYHIHPSVLDD
jgi:hypothetical protein